MRFDLRPGIRRLFRLAPRDRQTAHADIDDELESLVASRVEYLTARGMAPDAARDEALRRIGTDLDDARRQLHTSAEHRERHMRLHEQIENVWLDLRYAARGLARRRAFTAIAILTLAIGIGATTAIFSAVNALLLRPLPYVKPDELMKITLVTPPRGDRPSRDDMVWSYPKFTVFRDAQRAFSSLALYGGNQYTLTGGSDVERVSGEAVGATLLRTLGVRVAHGQDFDPSVDALPGAARVAILSDRLWQRRFNADPAIVGKTVDIDKQPYTVVGVTPPGFRGLSGQAEVFVPVTAIPASVLGQAQSHSWWLVGRRAPGVTEAQATAAVTVLGARVGDAFPNDMDKVRWGAKATPLNGSRVAPAIKRLLLILFGAVGLVLLIACVNVANLLLGRASVRRREIALRLAIGASRQRLLRLLLTESVLLSSMGAAAGLVVAWAGVKALGAIDPATTLQVGKSTGLGAIAFSSITVDWSTLAFTMAVALVVGLLFGLAPALSATRASLTESMADSRSASAGTGAAGGRRILLVAEVALALVLLAGSGLMIRSLVNLMSIDAGFDGTNVLTARLAVPVFDVRDSMADFYTQLVSRVRAVPGVVEASLDNCAPLSGGCNGTIIEFPDRPKVDLAHSPDVAVDWVSPTWFATMRVSLLRGRVFTNADRIGTPSVMVINDVAARKFWPNEDPIGKPIDVGQGALKNAVVIGVVRGVRQTADSEPRPTVYMSYQQSPRPGLIMFVRTSRDAVSFAPAIRRAIHDVATQFPVYDIKTMDERTLAATARSRFTAVLLSLFALTALTLAAIGIYGVMALAVTSRTREIGIRIALGADRRRVQAMVIGESVGIAAIGTAIGLAGALAATRVLRTLLFGLAPTDPATYVTIVVLLVITAIIASWVPARRASRVDPIEALRAD